ncbi:3'(2'),5'-bisphosphate nucleotidase CysQ [Aureimonas endophytica]|uniref:3'(2'),5'-bisphosphate nucleotidase CysQ n=1 Tax=Aureimonas endophytica TaxID=2027858 RepID=A0A917EEH8_9HYPH|nr:3'(2'),5'-bisphosphate nucleotidase CysQ [Aureimonas endophytica]GGE24068.1 3'(2'),5'-bisphosphate nucleotidase CysQ [Aureimonas endophytica]
MIDAALLAGRRIMRGFGGARTHDAKADGSPVTECDREAEELIADRLRPVFAGLPIVAEEAVSTGHVPPELGRRFLLVDPLDGTREFVAGLPDFTVNIAVVEEGAPVAGVVFAPAFGELFFTAGRGAFKEIVEAEGARRDAHPIAARIAPERLIAVVSRSHYDSDADAFLGTHAIDAVVPVGSSLKFCRIAEGAADLYPKLGRTMEWDTAAGHAVLQAAGGAVLRRDGSPLAYGKRGLAGEADFANPHFYARGRES